MNTNADNLEDLIHNYCIKHGLKEEFIIALSHGILTPEIHEWLRHPANKLGRNKLRSNAQNAAIHLYCTFLADKLNAAGFDMAHYPYKEAMQIPWTMQTVKDYLWRPIMRVGLHKESTTNLTSEEVSKVYDTLNRYVGEKTGVFVEFPSEETLFHNYL